MTDSKLSTRYEPKQVEEKWYLRWSEEDLFSPSACSERRPGGQPYCITIPPPNVTGSLHMGHALCYSVQDVLGRWKRMQGYEVLVLPGIDHAGIATQKVVEARLQEEGKSRYDLGRDAFVQRVWQWKEEYGGVILRQFKRLGFAFDWSRERFTMDSQYHDAVLRVFIDWFERGLIYRGKRIVNWDPVLRTSVSDIEVYDEIRRGKLYHFRYPFEDGNGYIVIATTRPETMLADVAVAVNPKDERYQKVIGKTLILPLVGRKIPLIVDEYPDPEFGTGAVKVTPAHDPNDYEIGVRMGLDFTDTAQVPVCIDEEARVICPGLPYHGLDRYEARKRIVADLEDQGLIEKIEDYDIPLKISDRSGQAVEPLLSEQWFCSMQTLASPAIEAVRSGQIRFTPQRYTEVYLRWMEGIRDWCLSRQLWWGHRVPVYYTDKGEAIAAMTQSEAEEKAGCPVTQDNDVLDTWFSSALWPFATLGWPEKTEILEKFYPTDVLVTARDIIYLWVARMIMDGLDQMKAIPFRDVYIYATVLTEDGKRMSKSLGTGIDPIEYIDKFGADAMRFSLLVQTGHNQEIRFGDKRIEEARNFCNKIWNASRFALMNLEGEKVPSVHEGAPPRSSMRVEDLWIMSRLAFCADEVTNALEQYNMMEACKQLHSFFWGEFCDWYIELAKVRLRDESDRYIPQWLVVKTLDIFCRLAHPFMPHLTEELWHSLPGVSESEYLDFAQWPQLPAQWRDSTIEYEMQKQMAMVRSVRGLRQEFGINPGDKLDVLYYEGDGVNESLIVSQSWFERIERSKPSQQCVSTIANGVVFYLPIEGLFDPIEEIKRLKKKVEKTQKELEVVMARLNNPQYLAKANVEVVEKDKESFASTSEKLNLLVSWIKQIEQIS